MMFTLINNEVKKLMSRKKTIVITIAFALLVGFIGFATYKEAATRKEFNKPENRVQREMENIKYLKEDKNNPNTPKDSKERIDEDIKEANKRIEDIKKELKSGKPDWRVTLKGDIKSCEEELKNPNIDNSQKEFMKNDIKFKKYLLAKDIEPEYNSYDVSATKFLRTLFKALGMIFLAVGVIVFSSDMVSGEYTPPTMKFLLTQPVSRGKILFSKFVALILSSTVIIVAVELLGFLIMGLIFNFGDMNYPVEVGTRFMYDVTARAQDGEKVIKMIAGSSYIIPMWKYLIKMILFQVLFIITSASFAFLFSTVAKSSMVSMAGSIVAIIAFNVFGVVPYIKKITHYLFISYGDPNSVLTGSMATGFNNPSITPKFVIILLLVWTLISYIISHIVFTKKDILI